jgi:hypothetical protein
MLDLSGVSPNRVLWVNNVQQFSTHEAFDPFFDAAGVFGYGAQGAGTSFLDGWFRDVVLFDAPLTASQRFSWYRYLIGLDSSPPI